MDSEDRAIEQAAIALCWDARPALIGRFPDDHDRATWWQSMPDMERRLYLRRARIAIEEWEAQHAA